MEHFRAHLHSSSVRSCGCFLPSWVLCVVNAAGYGVHKSAGVGGTIDILHCTRTWYASAAAAAAPVTLAVPGTRTYSGVHIMMHTAPCTNMLVRVFFMRPLIPGGPRPVTSIPPSCSRPILRHHTTVYYRLEEMLADKSMREFLCSSFFVTRKLTAVLPKIKISP